MPWRADQLRAPLGLLGHAIELAVDSRELALDGELPIQPCTYPPKMGERNNSGDARSIRGSSKTFIQF